MNHETGIKTVRLIPPLPKPPPLTDTKALHAADILESTGDKDMRDAALWLRGYVERRQEDYMVRRLEVETGRSTTDIRRELRRKKAELGEIPNIVPTPKPRRKRRDVLAQDVAECVSILRMLQEKGIVA